MKLALLAVFLPLACGVAFGVPVRQVAELVDPRSGADGEFGYSAALTGDLLAVGAPQFGGFDGVVFSTRISGEAGVCRPSLGRPAAKLSNSAFRSR
jgi:hypothetical protein